EADSEALTKRFLEMDDALRRLHACNGLSAAVYTQTTDVETEINGLMTYDRAVTKPDVKRVHDANTALTADAPPRSAARRPAWARLPPAPPPRGPGRHGRAATPTPHGVSSSGPQ